MRFPKWALLLALPAAWAALSLAQDDESDEASYPRVVAVQFRSDQGNDSKEIEKRFLAKLRAEYSEKEVLFVTVDTGSKAGRTQGRMLLNVLDLGSVWSGWSKKGAQVVLVDFGMGSAVQALTARDDEKSARAALDKALAGDDEEGMDDSGDEEDEPMDDEEER